MRRYAPVCAGNIIATAAKAIAIGLFDMFDKSAKDLAQAQADLDYARSRLRTGASAATAAVDGAFVKAIDRVKSMDGAVRERVRDTLKLTNVLLLSQYDALH